MAKTEDEFIEQVLLIELAQSNARLRTQVIALRGAAKKVIEWRNRQKKSGITIDGLDDYITTLQVAVEAHDG